MNGPKRPTGFGFYCFEFQVQSRRLLSTQSGADLGTISGVGWECREQGEDLGASDVWRKRNW